MWKRWFEVAHFQMWSWPLVWFQGWLELDWSDIRLTSYPRDPYQLVGDGGPREAPI